MVNVAFQSVFYLEMHQNNIFFKKNIFDRDISKQFKNIKKLIQSKKSKKNLKSY
jgi:hypothetical protein